MGENNQTWRGSPEHIFNVRRCAVRNVQNNVKSYSEPKTVKSILLAVNYFSHGMFCRREC